MWAIIWREIKLNYTKVYWLITNFISPIYYLIFFGLIFSSAIGNVVIDRTEVTYLHFFIPGLIVMQSFLALSFVLSRVNLDRRCRIIEMINATATSITEYFFGRLISVQFLVLAKSVLLWLLSILLLKFPIVNSMIMAGIILITLFLGNCIWFSIGFVLGLAIKTEDIRDIVTQFMILPLTFLSNIYYPTRNAPGLLQIVIMVNPLTHATNVIRPALLSLHTINAASFTLLLAYAIASMALSLFFVRRWSIYEN